MVVEDRPTIEGLRRHISRQRQGFHAVHYLGHADPRSLSLESPQGKALLVASQQFRALLQQKPRPEARGLHRLRDRPSPRPRRPDALAGQAFRHAPPGGARSSISCRTISATPR
ncbi:MAG: hypothetical protein ACOCY0_03110, partial [Roseicyclus sp.]